MNEVTSRSIRMHDNGYCSQARTAHLSVQTIKDGVMIIQDILKKDVLCRHDVREINEVYQAIDLLERKIDFIDPGCNSGHALQSVIGKVKKLADYNCNGNKDTDQTIRAKNLISLYHLQNFLDKDLSFETYFKKLLSKFKEGKERVATYLPCCDSEKEFDKDIGSLIGPNPSGDATKFLDRKREQMRSHGRLKQTIENKKSGLDECRTNNPQSYPSYFDELLDNGYVHLYDHLIQMRSLSSRNERRSAIEKMTFSQISHIALETREAVIQKVASSILVGHKNILLLLGGSGAGKSTTLCFLCGDKMVLKDFHYQSQSDKSKLIGHQGAVSCTFLPTIEVVNDFVIVDFPGFDDTNGPIISMGMEFALKALITMYHPKVLVIEAITNIEGRFAAAAQLGSRLRRLLTDPENCILGITKYSKDPDFGRIKAIEEQQKMERLIPTPEESQLNIKILTLTELEIPNLLPKIEELKEQLAKIKQKQAQEKQLSLPETDEKKASRERIQERENELLKQIGLKSIVRFSDLEDANHLSDCHENFSKTQSIDLNPMQPLDSEDKQLLKILFESNLKKEMEIQNYVIDVKDFKDFEQSVLESSLIKTVFFQSNPEIGQFLHLPEIDPKIVREYDKDIVGNCIKEYMRSIISTLNVSVIEQILAEMHVPKKKSEILMQKLDKLRDYIMGLLGVPLSEDKGKAKEQWKAIQAEYKAAMDDVEKRFTLSPWVKVCLFIPVGIPFGIFTLLKWNRQSQASQQKSEEIVDRCCTNLDDLYETLQRLKDLEKVVEKKEAIDEAFNSVTISEASETSMLKRINKVKNIYGNEEWDKRVLFLANKFLLTDFNPNIELHITLLQIQAFSLIEPGVKYNIEMKKFPEVGDKGILNVYRNLLINYVNREWDVFVYKNEKILTRVSDSGLVPTFAIDFNNLSLPNQHLLLNRALFAAALLKAYEIRKIESAKK